MNHPVRLNPRKLPLSKWTAVQPQLKEMHFLVIRVLLSGRNTLTESSPGFTDQMSRSLREMAIGLE